MEKRIVTELTPDELKALIQQAVNNALHAHNTPPQPDAPDAGGSPFVTVKEAAALLSCSPGTIRNLSKSGTLRRVVVGGSVRYKRADILALGKTVRR